MLRLRLGVAAACALVLLTGLTPTPAVTRSEPFGAGSLAGSGRATMRLENLPARVGRFAAVPGGGEVWAIGLSSGLAGGDDQSQAGQVVFLKRVKGRWSLVGAPRDTAGRAFNPTLFAFSFARNGEGWAVGDEGVLLRRRPSSDRWVQDAASGSVTTLQLSGISLAPNGAAAGFAVGADATILRLSEGRWTLDEPGADIVADGRPDLTAVSTISADEAWAVTGSTSQNLRVYRRTPAGWRRVSTGNRIFDGPHPADAPNGGTVSAAFGSAVAATSGGAWVGGSLFPSNATQPFGDDTPGDRSRPFVLRVSEGGATRSYCPDDYALRRTAANVTVDRTALCDEPFPLSAFDVSSLTVFEKNQEVFATGLGLFHFRNGGWFREPNANGYLVSMAMTSPTEGWAATTANTFGSGGAVHSDETVAGHWTADPPRPSVARWPQPQFQPLEAVAVRPDGSGRAVAVGAEGAVLSYEPGAGWDTDIRIGPESLHAVAWSSANEAWAVGEAGILSRYDGTAWRRDPASGALTSGALFGVAFAPDGTGRAVGEAGAILRFDGRRWSKDVSPVSGTLYAVAATPAGFVAVGAGGTVVEHTGSAWRRDPGVSALVSRPGLDESTLYAVTALPDGSVYAGGAHGAVVHRASGRAFARAPKALEGTILSLSTAGGTVVAAVSPDPAKYRGDQIVATRAALMVDDGSGWRDLHLDRRRSIYSNTDTSMFTDPPLGVVLEPSGARGWAVGGTPAQTPDAEGHVRSVPTSSVYRIDLESDPAPADVIAEVVMPKDGFTFAAFSESWCERGLCSATVGSGTQADLVAMQIQREIERAAAIPGGPRFVMFAGNLRNTAIPEELYEMRAHLQKYSIPVFGAIGDRDLFKGYENETVGSAMRTGNLSNVAGNRGDNSYWKEIFARMPAPWGEGRSGDGAPPPGFVIPEIPGNASPISGMARTHYVFDYAPSGRRLMRFIVVDSSTRSYGQPTDQNPAEAQNGWLDRVLTDARGVGASDPVPTIVVMNQPTVLPDRNHLPNWQGSDKVTFESAVVANGVSAIFTGGMRVNTATGLPNPEAQVVPMFVVGAGGAPLGFESPVPNVNATKVPSDGFYHAWNLVHVGEARPNATGNLQSPVTVTPFPILESLAIDAIDGRNVAGGNTLRFSALARGLSGGFSDPEQAKTTYFTLGNDALLQCEGRGPGGTVCQSRDALNPPYRFYSENPDIADFVLPGFGGNPGEPQLVDGRPTRDPTGRNGLLCTFKAGTANINVVSGFHRARISLKVGSGSGPCTPKPVIAPPPEIVRPPAPEVPPSQVVREDPRFFPRTDSAGASIFPPIPAPVVAPAPPGAPGVGRKEEHEQSWETEGHGQETKKYSFVAREQPSAVPQLWPLLGGVMLLAFFGACAAAKAGERVPGYRTARARAADMRRRRSGCGCDVVDVRWWT